MAEEGNNQFIFINSASRAVGGTPSNFTITINGALNAEKFMQLESVTMPLQCNNIDPAYQNNGFIFQEVSSGGALLTAKLTAAIYTSANIAAAVQTAMNSATGATLTYTVSYSALNNTLTISATGNFTIRVDQFATNGFTNAAPTYGFDPFTNPGFAATYTTPYMLDLTVGDIGIDLTEIPNAYFSTAQSFRPDFVIPNNQNSTGILKYTRGCGFPQRRNFNGKMSPTYFQIQVLNRYGLPLPLLGNWTMVLSYQ